MGSFIPVQLDHSKQNQNYSEELKIFTQELERNSSLQISQFCSSRSISYQGFRSYLENNNVNVKQLRMQSRQKIVGASGEFFNSEPLADVFIKLPSQVEVTIPSVLPSQLSNLLKLL